jgi:hypothetical protein
MKTMFDSYDHIKESYVVPTNEHSHNHNYNIINDEAPQELFNITNKFIGYTCNRNNTFKLNISADKTFKVRDDSLIYKVSGETPSTETVGVACQQAYNIVDNISWTCTGMFNGLYVWIISQILFSQLFTLVRTATLCA